LHLWWLLVLVPLLRPRHAVLLAPIVATGAWAWSVGGDFMAYSRFLLPATALLAGLVGWLLADLDRWVSRRTGRERHVGFAAGLLLAGATATGLPGRIELDRSRPWLPVRRADPTGRWESVSAMDQFARVRLAAGRWMREHLPADVRISVGAAGALPWASGLFAIDAYGLVDPGVLEWATPDASSRARPGHQLVAPMSYVLEREPDLVCHVGHAGPRRPTPARARTFGRDFRWACIELGRIDGPRGPIDAGYYCCLRDRTTVVGPFGAEERGK
jgi:arabinofuranosyltransferase